MDKQILCSKPVGHNSEAGCLRHSNAAEMLMSTLMLLHAGRLYSTRNTGWIYP